MDCGDQEFIPIVKLLKWLVETIQIIAPIGLIIMGSIDFGKAVVATDPDKIKNGRKTFMRRCLAAVMVFLVSTIVIFITNFVGERTWKNCWDQVESASDK